MVCLEVLLETRDLGLKRGRGSSLLHSLLYSTNCRYHRIRRAPRCGQPDRDGTSKNWIGWGGGFYHTRVVRCGRESKGWRNWRGMGRPDWGGKGERLGVSRRDGTSVRCRSAGVEYPKDYSWLVRPLSDKIWAPAPSRGGPWHLGNPAISEANKAQTECFEPAVVWRQRHCPFPNPILFIFYFIFNVIPSWLKTISK